MAPITTLNVPGATNPVGATPDQDTYIATNQAPKKQTANHARAINGEEDTRAVELGAMVVDSQKKTVGVAPGCRLNAPKQQTHPRDLFFFT